MEKETAWSRIEERIEEAKDLDFVEEDFIVDKDPSSNLIERETIPDGYKLAGIRIRSKKKISKEDCNNLVSDLVDNLENGNAELVETLKNGTVIEEEAKGEIRALAILLDPEAADVVWKMFKDETSCTPVIMSHRRWEEEKVLREKVRKEKETEEKLL